MPSELFIAGAVACFILGFVLGRISKSSDSDRNRPVQISIPPGVVSDQLEDRLRFLLRDGKKIEAIKELRQHLGLGLKESKDVVDAMERGKTLREMIDANVPRIGS